MAEVLGSMTGLELRQDKAERTYWYDKELRKRIPEEEALGSMIDVDSEQKQGPAKAIWHNHDHDEPVTIVGIHGRMGDEDYLMAEETSAGIPRSELEFVDEIPADDREDYIKHLEMDNHRLEGQNLLLNHQIEELEEEKADLQRIIKHNNERFGRLEAEMGELRFQIEEPDKEVAGFQRQDLVALLVEDGDEDEDVYELGYKVVGFGGNEENPLIDIENIETHERLMADPNHLVREDELEGEGEQLPSSVSESALRRRWNRLSGAIGRTILRPQVSAMNGSYNLVSRWRGRPIGVYEADEIVDDYWPPERNVGAAVLVAAGLVGAGVIGYLIGQKTGHHIGVINHEHTHTITVPGSNNRSASVFGIPGPNSSGRHIDFYNSAAGHRLTGIDMPKRLHLSGLSGRQKLVDDSGNVVVPHHLLSWDRQGNLSRTTRAYLRARNYLLTQGNLGKRYMTAVWSR